MRQLRAWLVRLTGLFNKRQRERELAKELESQLQVHMENNLRAGMTAQEARRQALIELGRLEQINEVQRRALPAVETLLQDLRYGLRSLLKRPDFTAVAVLTLSLGVGASIAIFSVVNAVLLRSLPYKDPDRLLMLWEKTSQQDLPTSYLNFVDWKDQSQVFEKMAAFRNDNFNLTGVGESERLDSTTVSADLLSTLGIRPVLGRDFLPQDDRPGSAPTLILTYDFWQRKFGGDTSIVGRQLTLNRQSFTVIGVTPAHFKFGGGDILVPVNLMADRFQLRGKDPGVIVVARMRPGVTPEGARTEMDAIMSRLVQQYPDVLAGRQIVLRTLHENTVGNLAPTLLVLMGAVAFVLLIACTNVANLLLARASDREKESAIRSALGASRRRLFQQFVTEAVVLSLAGGLLGLLLAYLVMEPLKAFSPGTIPRMDEIEMDFRVLAFAGSISLLAGILSGLVPALQASKTDLNVALKEATRGSTGGRRSARSLLVVTEVALAFALLIGAGLMIASFWKLQKVDPGFEARNLLTMQMALSPARGNGNQVASFLDQLRQAIQGLPGVLGVAFSNGLPFSGANQLPLIVEGRPEGIGAQNPIAALYITSPNYFEVMKIRTLKGRAFSAADTRETPPVVVIDQILAQKYFPNEDPIGKRLSPAIPSPPLLEIVGIVEHVKNLDLDGRSPVQPQFYLNFDQIPKQSLPSMVGRLNFIIRTGSDPLSLVASVRRQVASLDKDQPVFNVRTMEAKVAETIVPQRFSMLLLSLYAFVALVLAAVGIYGVMAYSVNQRRHEIGIRMALGASRNDILHLIVRKGIVLAGLGLLIGSAGSLGLTHFLSSLLFGVTPTDPATFAGVALLLLAVALAASYIPARRATRADPIVALRYE